MPKELTHWWLAAESRNYLEQNGTSPDLLRVIDANPRLFLLGAVGPDFLFYYLSGKDLAAFKEAAMILHGTHGGNTFLPVLRRLKADGGKVPDPVKAFLFGYICHVVSDSVFHPLVLYYVGKGDPGSRYDHHLFEAVLDLYVKDVLRPSGSLPLTLRELTRGMEMDRSSFLELLGDVSFGGKPYNRKALALCLGRYEFLQELFWTVSGRTFSRLLAFIVPSQAHFEASFYQKRFSSLAEKFSGRISYRHPVTGDEKDRSIEDLKNEVAAAVARVAEIFPDIESLAGPNLETGIAGDKADRIVFTAPKRLAGFFGLKGRKAR